jgi:putative transposase
MEMYIEAVSTRKVKDITEELCGTSFSKSLVSSLAGRLDSELGRGGAGRWRPKVAPTCSWTLATRRIVCAVREDGMRKILAVEVADTESEATYQEMFRSLKRRGLSGVELVVSDYHEALKSAVSRHFQGTSHQRCLLSTT